MLQVRFPPCSFSFCRLWKAWSTWAPQPEVARPGDMSHILPWLATHAMGFKRPAKCQRPTCCHSPHIPVASSHGDCPRHSSTQGFQNLRSATWNRMCWTRFETHPRWSFLLNNGARPKQTQTELIVVQWLKLHRKRHREIMSTTTRKMCLIASQPPSRPRMGCDRVARSKTFNSQFGNPFKSKIPHDWKKLNIQFSYWLNGG